MAETPLIPFWLAAFFELCTRWLRNCVRKGTFFGMPLTENHRIYDQGSSFLVCSKEAGEALAPVWSILKTKLCLWGGPSIPWTRDENKWKCGMTSFSPSIRRKVKVRKMRWIFILSYHLISFRHKPCPYTWCWWKQGSLYWETVGSRLSPSSQTRT